MAVEREARFLMRQRGAGARDFHDLSFDLSLPNALRSASNTPAQVRGATPRTRPSIHKTPSPTPLAYVAEEQSDTVARPQYITPLQRRGRLNQGPASGRLQYITPRVVITRADEEGSAVKRRRVTESFDTVPAQVLPDIPEEEGIDLHKPGIEEEEEARQVSPFSVKKKRKRRSILLKSKRRSRGSLESATSHDETIVIELDDETRGDEDEEIETVTEYPDPLVRAEAAQKAGEDSVDEAENEDDEPEGEVELDVTEQVEDWPIPTTRVSGRARKKKRKSLGLPSKKRQRSSVMQRVALRDTHLTNTNTDEESEDLEQGDQSDEEARMRAPSMKNKKGRPGESPPDDGPTSSVASKRLQQPRPDGGGLKKGNNSEKAPTQSSRSSRKGRTTSPTRQRISASRADAAPIRQKDGEKQSSQVKRHSSKDRSEDNKLEIRVQRMSHFHRLNFNPEEDDDLAGPSDFPNKKTPNAIDVLAQICREIIGKNIQALKNSAERERGAKRAEWMRKMEVVKRFGDELEGRLLMMTAALDHNHALNLKLRQANKEKVKLGDKLRDLRRQREELKLKKDEIRRQNELSSKAFNDQHNLTTLLDDISLAAQIGREAQKRDDDSSDEEGIAKPNLALRLQLVMETVSSADGRIGLLDKVKNFNRQLEETITRL